MKRMKVFENAEMQIISIRLNKMRNMKMEK